MARLDERNRRILTTHTGSLPRPEALSALLFARMTHKPYDAAALARETTNAVAGIVKTQADVGIDIVSDGEQSKVSFQGYAADRLAGLEPITPKPGERQTRENMAFPGFYVGGAHSGSAKPKWACTGPIKYIGQEALAADLQNLKRALQGASAPDAFMPSVSPSSCAGFMENRYYKTDEEHVFAVAEALREEYEAIVAAGFQVQIDDPRFAMHYMLTPDEDVDQARVWARRRVEALNHALRNIPPERVRHHTCYGINMGPRVSDMEMKHLADIIVTIRAGFYSFEMANPRHEHEWRSWQHVAARDEIRRRRHQHRHPVDAREIHDGRGDAVVLRDRIVGLDIDHGIDRLGRHGGHHVVHVHADLLIVALPQPVRRPDRVHEHVADRGAGLVGDLAALELYLTSLMPELPLHVGDACGRCRICPFGITPTLVMPLSMSMMG